MCFYLETIYGRQSLLSQLIMQRKKFICVSPKSNIARQRFIHEMDSFHSCLVENETCNEYYLSSLNKEYYFILPKNEDKHWEIHR